MFVQFPINLFHIIIITNTQKMGGHTGPPLQDRRSLFIGDLKGQTYMFALFHIYVFDFTISTSISDLLNSTIEFFNNTTFC